jgi:hypothetical protein
MNNITNLSEMVCQVVQMQLNESKEPITMTAIEQTTRQIVQQVGRKAVAMILSATETKYPKRTASCDCGAEAEYVRKRATRLRTLFGPVSVKRAYYLCATCRKGQFPLDRQLGLRPNALSAEVTRLAALVGVQLPFQTGSELFGALTLVDISDQAMRKATQTVGQRVASQEAQGQQTAVDPAELLRRQREKRRPLRLYGSIDATKVHIRDAGEHRWRDLKLGAWYEARGKPPTTPDGEWRIVAENISYYADICPAVKFGDLFWSTGVQRDAQLARELVFLGDGAEWIWNLVDAHYPDAIQILDWFHATEHLMPVAQAIASSDAERLHWVAQMRDLLWHGLVADVIVALRQLQTSHADDVIRLTANYYETHQHRMRYKQFRDQGYQLGSGTIESAAKQIGMMRMKVPGAIWNEDNARHVAKARAAFLSNRWADLPLAV